MTFEYPDRYVAADEWDQYLIETIPALAKLWSNGKYEAFETWKVLNNLTHEEYVREIFNSGHIYAPYMPIMRKVIPQLMSAQIAGVQPMGDESGEIFHLKTK